MSDRSARDLKSVLSQVMEDYNLERQIQETNLFENWAEIVGSSLAKQCVPVSLEDDELTIKIRNSTWMDELSRRKKELRDLINDKIGQQRIKYIKLT